MTTSKLNSAIPQLPSGDIEKTAEFKSNGANFRYELTKQPWGMNECRSMILI